MSVATATNKVVSSGNGLTTVFSYNFRIDAAADVQVIYTDAVGVSTTLSTALYSISGLGLSGGGTVTYPLVGSPIASGTTLTIARILPLTQTVSISNQGAFYPESVELAVDRAVMEVQQIHEETSRTIVGPITDLTAMLPLPGAAQRANRGLLFDALGNPIAGTTPATGVISSPMQPVTSAASLAAGRLAFGLGGMAVEGLGRGMQDDGAGAARVDFHKTPKSSNYVVAATDHLEQFSVTGPITFTLPATSTLWNGFGFWTDVYGGTLTLTPNAADSAENNATGASSYVPSGAKAYVSTNGAGSWTVLRSKTTTAGSTPGGYLSPSATDVVILNDTTSTTLYYHPDVSGIAPIYNGSEWIDYPFGSLSCVLNATQQPANTVLDVFVTNVGGAPTLVIGPAWRQGGFGNGAGFTSLTNATPIVCTAAGHNLVDGDEVYFQGVVGNEAANGKWIVSGVAGSAFTLTGSVGSGAYTAGTGAFSSRGNGTGTTQISKNYGLYTNTVSMTAYNGVTPYAVPAGKGTYVGTIRTTGTAGSLTCERSWGQDRIWSVWNAYNRKTITLSSGDPTASWTTTTIGTWLRINSSSANSVTITIGLPEEIISFSHMASAACTSTFYSSGVGFTQYSVANGSEGRTAATSTTMSVASTNTHVSSPGIGTSITYMLYIQSLAATMTLYGSITRSRMTATFIG